MGHQYSLTLIKRQIEHSVVEQRTQDGYINATELCKAAGKRWYNYVRTEETGHFLRALAEATGLSSDKLVQEVRVQGVPSTWVHPQVAVNLGQWLSPQFAVKISQWVQDWLEGKGPPAHSAALPYHIERHMLNFGKIPQTHFSILQEMTFTLVAPMEVQGYRMPEKIVPDISQGLLFCKYAREKLRVDTDSLPTYEHEYPDGRKVPAKLYPIELLPEFRRFIAGTWMTERAGKYFKDRDPSALPAIDQMLAISAKPTPKRLA